MPVTPSESRAADIFNALDLPFTLPDVTLTAPAYTLPTSTGNPIYAAVHKVALSDLTEGTVTGNGAFEVLMASMQAHLQSQYDKGRITGDQYTKAYIELTSLAMSTGLQFVMGQEMAFWQAAAAREQAKALEIAAVTAAVVLETSKAQLATQRYQAELAQAQYTLTKLQLASEDARYMLAQEQITQTAKQTELLDKQLVMLQEQIEAAHAQHADNKVDGITPVAGTIKRQRDLLEEQRQAFIRSADAAVAKMYLDSWLTRKTIDEATPLPAELESTVVGDVLDQIKTRAGLV